jgi:uncharacterized protein
MHADADDLGPLELLVLQPTPFCNIDCSYCYLPDRDDRRQMSPDVLCRTFEAVFASGLVRHPFTALWHAGEPLVMPPRFYRNAAGLLHVCNSAGVAVYQAYQTNGTLITPEWCELFREQEAIVGVSVDGPAFLHDACRRTRRGAGTHARAMEGIRLLNEHAVPFHALTVLTDAALDYPDEMFDFYVAHGIREVGFNVEEMEGPHTKSSLQGADVPGRLRRFLDRFFGLALRAGPLLSVRELSNALASIRYAGGPGATRHQELRPFAVISVDCAGNFTTFSPELLGMAGPPYGDFILGNVSDGPLLGAASTPKLRLMRRDVAAGVARCRDTCSYFDVCGGGVPGNKFFENGSFDSTETLFCRLHRQAVIDAALAKLERGEVRLIAGREGREAPCC